ncbi:MAG: hypothetical protein ABSD56_03905 [Bryobacteraceae bacterium]
MGLLKAIRRRLVYWKRVLFHPWSVIAVVIWTVFSNAATFRDNFLPPDVQSQWRTIGLLPKWNWWVWVLGLLAITLCILLEASYREWVSQRRESEVEFQVHGIPSFGRFDGHLYLLVPDVTIINHSYRDSMSIGASLWLLYEPVGVEAHCPPESRPVMEWERAHDTYRHRILTFPLDLGARKTASGYICFCADNARALGNTPRRDAHDGLLTRIEFKDYHSDQVLYEKEVSFLGFAA